MRRPEDPRRALTRDLQARARELLLAGYTRTEAAEAVGVGRTTLGEWIRRGCLGDIPPVLIRGGTCPECGEAVPSTRTYCADDCRRTAERRRARQRDPQVATVQRALDEGCSMAEAARRAGVSHTTVAQWRDAGLVRTSRPRRPRAGEETRRQALDLLASGMPYRRVAAEVGVSRGTVLRWARDEERHQAQDAGT